MSSLFDTFDAHNLVDPTMSGDSYSVAEGVERYYASFQPWLVGYARMLDPDRAEDAVQDAFAALSARIEQPPPIENVEGYLVRIVQRKLRRPNNPLRVFLDRKANAHYDRYSDPDLAKAVARLPHQQRSCVALRFGKDLTVPAIAELLDVSPSTVKTHLNRAFETLRLELGPTEV